MKQSIKKLYWSARRSAKLKIKDSFVDPACKCLVRGKNIYIGVSSEIEAYRAWSYESKEPETLDWIDESIKPDSVFYDVGANIGLYSLYAALSQPAAKVYSFEPVAGNYVRLTRNIALNNARCITPVFVALGKATEFGYMSLSDMEYGSALHSFVVEGGKISSTRQGVISTTLDELVYKWNLPHPTHIKIDVDGNELAILNGAERVLASNVLKEILIEVSRDGEAKDPTILLLEKKNFKIYKKSEWSVNNGSSTYRNYILRRSE